jgi:hypothetical protein
MKCRKPAREKAAWRIVSATTLSRVVPDAPCPAILALEAWQALYGAIHYSGDRRMLLESGNIRYVDPPVAIGFEYEMIEGPDIIVVVLPAIGDNTYILRRFDGTPDVTIIGEALGNERMGIVWGKSAGGGLGWLYSRIARAADLPAAQHGALWGWIMYLLSVPCSLHGA